uniref:Aldehyde dehydrogenase n=1 Tax=Solanum tuberosum TaxID=4113 RepID=M0ZQ78_SOLTU
MTRSEQKNKCPSFSNTTAEMRFNGRKKYKEMLLAQKEALLLQRRTRDLESRRRLLQVPVMIREPYVTSTKGKAKACVMRPVVGDPFTKGVEQGPQINSGQFKKTLRCIREGRDSSAALECGDDTICSQSYFIQFKC